MKKTIKKSTIPKIIHQVFFDVGKGKDLKGSYISKIP